MTMPATQPTIVPPKTSRGRSWLRAPLILAAVLILIASTYALAWYRAYRLSAEFMASADASFAEGDYLLALNGFEEFDERSGRYIFRGGYGQVLRVWNNPYAWPIPEEVVRARARIDELIEERLSLTEAERFVQVNIGRSNPYLGRIYLRVGELYEEEGDLRGAEEVYEEVLELFGRDAALAERAEANLARLRQ
jgi:tetratricopeptide (TPR) repeat protein